MPQAPRVTAVPPADHPVRPPCAEAFRRLSTIGVSISATIDIPSCIVNRNGYKFEQKKSPREAGEFGFRPISCEFGQQVDLSR